MSNGNGNGHSASSKPDPFAQGVWLNTFIGNCNVLLMVDGSDEEGGPTEESIRAEMIQQRSVCVTALRKYVLSCVEFPMGEKDVRGNTKITPQRMNTMSKHETIMRLEHEFPTHAQLSAVSFLSDFHEEDVEYLRQMIRATDEHLETRARMKRSNIVAPTGNGAIL